MGAATNNAVSPVHVRGDALDCVDQAPKRDKRQADTVAARKAAPNRSPRPVSLLLVPFPCAEEVSFGEPVEA